MIAIPLSNFSGIPTGIIPNQLNTNKLINFLADVVDDQRLALEFNSVQVRGEPTSSEDWLVTL